MKIRKATESDIELLVSLRLDYFAASGREPDPDEAVTISSQLRRYFPKSMGEGSFIAMLAEENCRTVSAAYLAISERPANRTFPNGKVGTVLNVFTYPEYRRRGFAAATVSALIDEARLLGLSYLELSATADGKPLYDKLGFKVSRHTEMGLRLV